ncbi:MAG: hypothetical protein CL862_14120 [Cyanobium sp. NAT70]|nr:hypothetical protein [Cyanobium sp. NAT70]
MALQQCRHQLQINTSGQGFTRLDDRINQWLGSTGVLDGALHLTCLHTSASLTINENADPRVLEDLSSWMNRVVPRVHPYRHDDEGIDDMPAHIRTALTAQTMTLGIERGRLVLGCWQAVYLWEHRDAPHQRRIACHVIGEMTVEQEESTHNTKTKTLLSRRNDNRAN